MNSARLITLALAGTLTASLAGCFESPRDMPDASVIGYDGHSVIPPDCSKLASPSKLTDAGIRRPSMQWGCATYTNLAAQMANPEDAVAPHALGPADAAVAAGAVRRYEIGAQEKIDTSSVRDTK